ncbi:hypothetical protein A2U01_0049875, partial [Trifolium medium]|nr:hypothetical protein [Trifolium medium]
SDSKEVSSQKAPIQRSAAMMEETQPGRSFRNAVLRNRGEGAPMAESQVLKVPINEALCKELQGSMVGTL